MGCHQPNACSASGRKLCASKALCTALANGTFVCTCKEGYAGDGKICNEINACDDANACGGNAICSQTGPGSRICTCATGYDGDAYSNCSAIDSCMINHGGCGDIATCKSVGPGK